MESGNRITMSLGLVIALLSACGRSASPEPQEPAPNEVQVGYGTQSAKTMTGSVESVTEDDLSKIRVATVEELLEGRVAGLQVLRLPNGEFSLRIRGTSSITGSNEPLVVIDGMPVAQSGLRTAFSGLNPGDIRRIDVLKDAGSTAIYGARGANGVILISTKRN